MAEMQLPYAEMPTFRIQWDMAVVHFGHELANAERMTELLREGWEPFAVNNLAIFFRKAMKVPE